MTNGADEKPKEVSIDQANEKAEERVEEKAKRIVPVISYQELLDIELKNKKIGGPFKIKAEDAEKALEYFKRR